MSHAYGGRGRVRAGDAAREANLLGALSLAVAERSDRAVQAAAGSGGAAPAALVALATFLDGSSLDVMRRPLGLSHSAAVRLADRLAGDGLVRRDPGADARSVAIRITEEGNRLAAEIRTARERALESVLAPLSPEERAELTRLHEKLLGGLTGGRADAGRICRLCDSHACGHEEGRCPVTRAADAAESAAA
jgi:MarR family transcriptional regulator, negative regulator of the multidrug operon emrRAB